MSAGLPRCTGASGCGFRRDSFTSAVWLGVLFLAPVCKVFCIIFTILPAFVIRTMAAIFHASLRKRPSAVIGRALTGRPFSPDWADFGVFAIVGALSGLAWLGIETLGMTKE